MHSTGPCGEGAYISTSVPAGLVDNPQHSLHNVFSLQDLLRLVLTES